MQREEQAKLKVTFCKVMQFHKRSQKKLFRMSVYWGMYDGQVEDFVK